jgi:hypothetical protein
MNHAAVSVKMKIKFNAVGSLSQLLFLSALDSALRNNSTYYLLTDWLAAV